MPKKFWLVGAALCYASSVFAANPVDLSNQKISILQSFLLGKNQNALRVINKNTDVHQIEHIRLQSTFMNHDIWGGDIVIHIKNKKINQITDLLNHDNNNISMDGIIYEGIAKDLKNSPKYIFESSQSNRALETAISNFKKQNGNQNILNSQSKLIVYVDESNRAHWAFLVNFEIKPEIGKPMKPHYILDAISFKTYENWDDVKTLDNVSGGGNGGNVKLGKFVYDGLQNNLPVLSIQRDPVKKICFLNNADVIVKDMRKRQQTSQFPCPSTDPAHNNVYWNGTFDMVNGAYSPGNDALYYGDKILDLYQEWYKIPALITPNGKPMKLIMRVHDTGPYSENAYWDGQQMTFGDGGSTFYPFVSAGVAAHEISHGFTEQHSNLTGNGQAGGLNESFSDMASQALEYFTTQKNTWQLGAEILKPAGMSLRYMDKPSKDCNGAAPGDDCSIDSASQYHPGLDVHYSCGVFNRLFYLIATSTDWNTHKAFDVMVEANSHYWTSRATFKTAACGVVKAARVYKYDVPAVLSALKEVGIDGSKC